MSENRIPDLTWSKEKISFILSVLAKAASIYIASSDFSYPISSEWITR
jgi:hypothetical protein